MWKNSAKCLSINFRNRNMIEEKNETTIFWKLEKAERVLSTAVIKITIVNKNKIHYLEIYQTTGDLT